MTVREWSGIDYYRVLGVLPDASQAEIAASYRALARALHPDARPGDPAAAERFKRVTAAYRVLGDVDARRRYDGVRRGPAVSPRAPAPAMVPVASAGRGRLIRTTRGARMAVGGGVACLVLGLVASGLIVALHVHDAALRDRGETATAVVTATGGERRLEFTTRDGQRVRAREPLKTGTGKPPVGSRVDVRYDPDDPTEVITTEDTFARDITLWIVAVKLLVAGVFFVVLGARFLRRRDHREAPASPSSRPQPSMA